MKKNISDVMIVSFFLLFIFGFAVWTWIQPDLPASELENRKLATMPPLLAEKLWNGEYFKSFETYYNDQFPARGRWVELNAVIDKNVLRKDVIRSIYVHRDGYMINPVLENKNHSIKEIQRKISDFAKQLKLSGVDTYFALVPNKATMMEYKLPYYFPGEGNKLSGELINGFDKDLVALDLRSTIEPHMSEPNMYFYTDHHWKARAAYYAYEEIIRSISQKHTEVGLPLSKEQFVWEEYPAPFYGSDTRKTTKSYASKVDTVTIVKPNFEEKKYRVCYKGSCEQEFYDMSYLEAKGLYVNRYATYFSGDVPEGIVVNPNNTEGKKLLILKDSYANPMIQFFSRNFSETRILDLRHYKEKKVSEYIKQNNIDIVLFVHNINSIIWTKEFLRLD